MGLMAPSLTDILKGIDSRVKRLENSPYVRPNPGSVAEDPLTITGLAGANAFVNVPVTSEKRTNITWSWTAPAAPSSDNVYKDPVAYYMFSATVAGSSQTSPYQLVPGTTHTTMYMPVNTTVTGRVYAVTASGKTGPIASVVVDTTYGTAPPQPKAPTVTAMLAGVQVAYDGKDSTNVTMPIDVKYLEVHSSTSGAGFTPSATTYRERISGADTIYLSDLSGVYSTMYVKLVPYNSGGLAGPASSAGSATPRQAVSTDMGVVLPGQISYSDIDNLLIDGSLENPILRSSRMSGNVLGGGWSFDNTAGFAYNGDWALKAANVSDGNIDKYVYLNGYGAQLDEVAWLPNLKLYIAALIRGVSANGEAKVVVRWRSQTNVLTEVTAVTTTTSTGSYVLFEGVLVPPSDVKSFAIKAATYNATGGTWWFDAIQARRVTPTILIEDAAITRAKIANLAVGDAQIETLNAGKLIAGTVTADKLTLGAIRSNLVPDPSFEELYTMTVWEPFAGSVGNPFRWRLDNVQNVGSTVTKSTTGRSRSGKYALSVRVPAGIAGGVVSGAFPLVAGATYKLVVYACSLESVATMTVGVETGNGDEYSPWYYNAETLTGDATWSNPPLTTEPIDPAVYQRFAWEFTPPAGHTYGIVRILNFTPPATSTLVVDDVSCLIKGSGGSELTAAGIRIFDSEGFESGALVNNRPNTLSISKSGVGVASVDENGFGTFAGLSSNAEPSFLGMKLLGSWANFQSPSDNPPDGWMSQLPRGAIAFGWISGGGTVWNTRRGLQELAWLAEAGRAYRVTFGGVQCAVGAANTKTGFVMRNQTPTSIGGIAAQVHLDAGGGTDVIFDQDTVPTAAMERTFPSVNRILRCNITGDTSVGGELYAGINRLLVYVTGDLASITMPTGHNLNFYVEDIGPDIPTTNYANASTPGAPATTSPFKTYQSVWRATSATSYNGSQAAISGSVALYQGAYQWAPGGSGNQFAKAVFAGNAISGETSKTIATALSGATIKKVELLVYVAATYIGGVGGKLVIRPFNSTTIDNVIPSGSSITTPLLQQYTPYWINITSIATGSIRGFSIGQSPNTADTSYNMGIYGIGSLVDKEPQLRITYTR